MNALIARALYRRQPVEVTFGGGVAEIDQGPITDLAKRRRPDSFA
jgi:hypothetical protein